MIPLDELDQRYTNGIVVRVSEETHGLRGLEQLHEIVRGYPGPLSLELRLWLADGSKARCECDLRVAADPQMRERIDELLGPGNFRLITAKPTSVPAPKSKSGFVKAGARS